MSQQSAAAVINGLQNDNANTVLFDAINTAADMIWKVGDSSEKRRIITVISDGKDCADDTRNAESTENTLKSRGIPVYTMAVENNEGDTEAETQNYRSKFAAMARNTGGVPSNRRRWRNSSGWPPYSTGCGNEQLPCQIPGFQQPGKQQKRRFCA